MNRLDALSDRALEIAEALGENVRGVLPRAGELFDAGGKLVVLRTGARTASTFLRRHPVVIVAAIAGAGLVWYGMHRRAKRAQSEEEHEAIEGGAKRVDARRVRRSGQQSGAARVEDSAGEDHYSI